MGELAQSDITDEQRRVQQQELLAKVKEQNRLAKQQRNVLPPTQDPESSETPATETTSISSKPPEPEKKPVVPKKRKPKPPAPKEDLIDYGDHFNSFYDIFVGMQIDPKNFDLH